MEILDYAFMQRALFAGAIIGTLCAVMGVYVVLRGLSFIGAGIAHASFGGVAIGFVTGVNPVWTAIVFCLGIGWAIGLVSRKGRVKEDTAVGIFFASTMALGILLIGLMEGYNQDLFGYLFGSILAVAREDVWIVSAVGAGILAVVILFFKELLFVTFDPEMAQVSGVPAEKLYFLLISLIALTVVISIKVVGIVLVSALLITPAAAAHQWSENFRGMLVLAVIFALISTVGGLFLSYWFNTASGATIVLLSTMIFFASTVFSPRRKRRKSSVPSKALKDSNEVVQSVR